MASAYGKSRGRFWLFLPFLIAALIIAAWTAYWFIARGLLSDGIDNWIETERERGNIVEFSGKSLGGYPFRFVLTVEDPVYGNRDAAVWRGQQLQMVMQPWNWNHVIARTPGRNAIQLPGGAQADQVNVLLGARSVASFSWTDTGLKRISVALDEAALAIGDSPLGNIAEFELHLRPPPGDPQMLQLETHWQQLELAELSGDAAALGNTIGPSILRMEADLGMAVLEEGVALNAMPREVLARGGQVRIAQALLEWGPAHLGAKGEVGRPAGNVSGSVGVRIDEPDELRTALEQAGVMNDEIRQSIDALELASREGGFFTMSVRGDGLYFLGNQLVALPLDEAL